MLVGSLQYKLLYAGCFVICCNLSFVLFYCNNVHKFREIFKVRALLSSGAGCRNGNDKEADKLGEVGGVEP